MKKVFSEKDRKAISQGSVIFLFLYIFACYIATTEHYMPVLFSPLILIIVSVFFYILFEKYAIEGLLTKDKILASITSAFAVGGLVIYGWCYLNPKIEDLQESATEAEQTYFLLSAGSLDHGRICGAARKAQKLYSKLQDEEKVNMFNYILITDKCL